METSLNAEAVYKDHRISVVTLKRRCIHAKDCTKSIQRSLEVSDKGAINSLKTLKNSIIYWKLPQDGDTIFLPQRIRLHLRHHDGNQAATCVNVELGFVEIFNLGVNNDFFFFNRSR